MDSRGKLHTPPPPVEIDSEEFSIEAFRGVCPAALDGQSGKLLTCVMARTRIRLPAFTKCRGKGIANAELLSGKEMSYNNYVDADAAWQLVFDFEETACAIIKHTNPAGVAISPHAVEAYRKALATDPISALEALSLSIVPSTKQRREL
jgi:hypothetical protein